MSQPPVPGPSGPDPYGQTPYGQTPYGQTPYGAGWGAPAVEYAGWAQRVGAALLDSLLVAAVAAVPYVAGVVLVASATRTSTDAAGMTTSSVEDPGRLYAGVGLIALGALLALGVTIWNVLLRGGRTGWTVGKGALGIRVLRERDLEPQGAGMAFVRQLAHYVDGLICHLGYLWPLWDAKRQTIGDKIVGTVVIRQPKP